MSPEDRALFLNISVSREISAYNSAAITDHNACIF